MILRSLWLLATLVPYVLADVKFTAPAPGDSITGTTIDIKWEDGPDSPALANLVSYTLFLCTGGNDAASIVPLTALVTTGDFANGNKASGTFTTGLGGNVKNAYFLKMISATTGGSVINYSARFSLPSMVGTMPAAVAAALKTVTGTDGPPTDNQVTTPQNGGNAPGNPPAGAAEFNVPYTMQTGGVRYAPMQPVPGTRITAKNASPRWPTSTYTVFKAVAGPADVQTTITQAPTFVTHSMENTGADAGQPTDTAMARFLNRWKD